MEKGFREHRKVQNGRITVTKKDIVFLLQGALILIVLAYFFYRSIWVLPVLSPLLVIYVKYKRKEQEEQEKWELCQNFREAIGFVNANLQAGYSNENAFRNTYTELCSMFGAKARITKEWFYLTSGLNSGQLLEEMLQIFAQRSRVADIDDFAQVFKLAKKSGGNFSEMIEAYAESINGKAEVIREVKTSMSEKEFEFKIMIVVPFAILLYINLSSPGFFDSLYHNTFGVFIMSAFLLVYLSAIWLGKKVTTITI